MANTKVLGDDSDGCGCGSSGGGIGLAPSLNPAEQIIVRHKPGTLTGNSINAFVEGGKQIYQLEDLDLDFPIVNFLNDFPIVEVGQNIALVTFNGSIVAATFPIATRQIFPDPGGLDLTAPFNFTKANVKRTSPGVSHLHTVTAVDTQGNSTAKASGVYAKNAIYQGFNASNVLTQAQIKALANKALKDSILENYGGLHNYVVPGSVPLYIYWCGMIGSPIIGSATLNGFALPLTDVGPISVTNIHDGAISVSYWVKRTANKFNPGTYPIFTS